MKIEWFITNVIAGRGPSEQKVAIFEFSAKSWATFTVREALCNLETPSRALKALSTMLIANVTAVGTLARADDGVFWAILTCFGQDGPLCGPGSILWSTFYKPFLNPKNHT